MVARILLALVVACVHLLALVGDAVADYYYQHDYLYDYYYGTCYHLRRVHFDDDEEWSVDPVGGC